MIWVRVKLSISLFQNQKLLHVICLCVQSVVGLSSDVELDTMDCCKDVTKWTWFNQYCLAARMAKSLQNRTPIPAK